MFHSICILNRCFGSVQDPARLHRIEARGEIAGLELVRDMSMGPWYVHDGPRVCFSVLVTDSETGWKYTLNMDEYVVTCCHIWDERMEVNGDVLGAPIEFEPDTRETLPCAGKVSPCWAELLNIPVLYCFIFLLPIFGYWVQKGGLQMNSHLREVSKMDIVWDERHERWDLWKRHRKASCLNTLAHTMRTHEGIERKVKFMWRWSVLWLRVVVKSL